MKKIFFVAALTITLSVAVWSCKKDAAPANQNPIDNTLPTEQPAALGDSLGDILDNPTMADASMSADLTYESYPAFLETDYFNLAVVEGANGSGNIDSINKICCGSFKLSKAQKEKLVAAHKAKEECMDANRKILKNIDEEIKAWAKTQKENIIAKTKLQMDSINKLYAAGTITAAQKKEMANKLELTRADLLKGLAAKAKDKIKNNIIRAAASGKIKDCEKIYLKSIKEILTAEQFEKWVKCFKEKYKKK
jgi:hypothetical protein